MNMGLIGGTVGYHLLRRISADGETGYCDGSAYEGHCVVTKGEPTKPHTAEDLSGKFFELGEAVWGKPTTQSLFDGLMRLDKIENFQAFADRLAL